MFLVSKEKVHARAEIMLERVENLQRRLKVYDDREKIVGSILGPMPGFDDLKRLLGELHEILLQAQVDLKFGRDRPRSINKGLDQVSQTVEQMSSFIDQMDSGRAAGRQAFEKKYGT